MGDIPRQPPAEPAVTIPNASATARATGAAGGQHRQTRGFMSAFNAATPN